MCTILPNRAQSYLIVHNRAQSYLIGNLRFMTVIYLLEKLKTNYGNEKDYTEDYKKSH